MRVDLFDFHLPEERIALRPAEPRDAARLLVIPREGPFIDAEVRDLPGLLRPGDLMIANDTRVLPVQLSAIRPPRGEGGATEPVEIGLTLIEELAADRWRALAKPLRRLRVGDALVMAEGLTGTVAAIEEGLAAEIAFNLAGDALKAAFAEAGAMPLPPYIASRRPADERDRSDYQTAYARHDGSVAAPTAGLHFTPSLLERLAARGVGWETVTLHVGPGTFLPVKAEDTEAHRMHAEWGRVRAQPILDKLAGPGGARDPARRLVAVGTTSLRLIETAARRTGQLEDYEDWTDIFITPGFEFRAADMLMTNFHLPRSTLFMLVAAFAGLERMRAAYAHAIEEGYRFYSYGDACLIERAGP